MTPEEAQRNLLVYLSAYYPHTDINDLEPTESPGYFRHKTPCGGKAGGCTAMIHTTLFNEGPCQHTISYYDPWKDKRTGKFVSPYKTWKALKEHPEFLRKEVQKNEA